MTSYALSLMVVVVDPRRLDLVFLAGKPAGSLDRGQTRETCEKQEKYFKGKVVISTVRSLILRQYPVDLLTFLELY